MCFIVAFICLCKPLERFVCVIVQVAALCRGMFGDTAIFSVGPVTSSSISHLFYPNYSTDSLQNRRSIHWLHSFKIRRFFLRIGLAVLRISPFECGLLLIPCCFLIFPCKFHNPDTAVVLICVFLNTYFCWRPLLFCLVVLVLVILVACFWISCLLRI